MAADSLEARAREVAPAVLRLLEEFRWKSYVLSREDLVGRLGVSDRVLRAAIAELRKQGQLVVADEDGGYRFARSWADVARYTASLKSRITALHLVVAQMETLARKQFPGEEEQLGLW